MSRALRIRPMCLAYQKWCPAWRQNKTCESFARRVSRIYRATSNRADYRIIINWNVTSGQRVILLYIIFIYFVIIWLHLIFTLPLPRTLVHCQLLIGMQTAVNIVGKVARICAMFWFMIMQNESRSQGLSNHWFIVWSPYFFFFWIFGYSLISETGRFWWAGETLMEAVASWNKTGIIHILSNYLWLLSGHKRASQSKVPKPKQKPSPSSTLDHRINQN